VLVTSKKELRIWRRSSSAPAAKADVHQRAFVGEAILGHARRGAKHLDVGEVRLEHAHLGDEVHHQRVELVGTQRRPREMITAEVGDGRKRSGRCVHAARAVKNVNVISRSRGLA